MKGKEVNANDNIYTIKYEEGIINCWYMYINGTMYGGGFKTEIDAMKALMRYIKDERDNITIFNPIEEVEFNSEDEFIEVVRDKLISLALVALEEKEKSIEGALDTLDVVVVKVYKCNGTEYTAEIKLFRKDNDKWYNLYITNRDTDEYIYIGVKTLEDKDS